MMDIENHIKREFILLSKLKEEAEELHAQYRLLMQAKRSPQKSTVILKNRELSSILKDLHEINQEIKIVIDDLIKDTPKFEHDYLISQITHYNNYGELEVPIFNYKQVPIGLKIYTFIIFGIISFTFLITIFNFSIPNLLCLLSLTSILGFGAYFYNLKAKEKHKEVLDELEFATMETLFDYLDNIGKTDDIKILKNHNKNTKAFIENFKEDLHIYKQFFNESFEIEKDCYEDYKLESSKSPKEKQKKLNQIKIIS